MRRIINGVLYVIMFCADVSLWIDKQKKKYKPKRK